MPHSAPKDLPSSFSDLSNYASIIFYDEEHPILTTFTDSLLPPYCILNLSADPELREDLIKIYSLNKLPAMLLNDNIYYENDNIVKTNVSNRVIKLVNNLLLENENVIFIKGTPTRPECGFTSKLVNLLNEAGLEGKYAYFNIFEDEGLRQELKEINKWPTFPQVYLKKKFIGGLDVVKGMVENGEALN